MVASTSPITITLNPETLSQMYLNQNLSLKQNMDVMAAIGGGRQLLNLHPTTNVSEAVTIYFKFFNLDLPDIATAKVYSLEIIAFDTYSKVCMTCPGSTTQNMKVLKC